MELDDILSAILGGIGNGKTLLMLYMALLHYLTGYNIISNFNLKIPYKHITKLEDIEKILQKNARLDTCMLMDEGWITMDSRKSMSKGNVVWSNFTLQTRKVFFDVFLTAQNIGQIDTRFRSVCDRYFFPNITEWEGKPKKTKPLEMRVLCVQRNVLGELMPYNNVTIKITDGLLDLYDTRESMTIMG